MNEQSDKSSKTKQKTQENGNSHRWKVGMLIKCRHNNDKGDDDDGFERE